MRRPHFESVTAYGRLFTDAAYWRPYVAAICARHGLGRCGEVRSGLPGTFPVFIVAGRYVVKLSRAAGDTGCPARNAGDGARPDRPPLDRGGVRP